MRPSRDIKAAAAIAAVALLAATTPATSLAQAVVDPGSPAGRQYVLPIEEARQKGAGNEDFNASPVAGRTAPSFGEGVTTPAANAGKGAAAKLVPGEPAGSTPGSTAPELDEDSGLLVPAAALLGAAIIGLALFFALRRRPRAA